MGTQKNVLLLNMSRLQGNNMNFYYSDIDVVEDGKKQVKRCFYRGVSSLEPGTKNILWRLAREGKYIDKIIILATPETKGEGKAVEVYKENIRKYLLEGEKGAYTETEIIDKYAQDVDVNAKDVLDEVKKYCKENFPKEITGLKLESKVCQAMENAIYTNCVGEEGNKLEGEKNPGAKEFEEYLQGYSEEQKKKLNERLEALLEKNVNAEELEKYEFLFEKHSLQGTQIAGLGEQLEKIPLLRMKFLSHCYAKQMYESKKDEIIIHTLDEANKELMEKNRQLLSRNQELVDMIQKLQKRIEELTKMKEKKIKACIRACLIMCYYEYVNEFCEETNVSGRCEIQSEYDARMKNDPDFFKVIDMESLEVRYEAIPEVVEAITNLKKTEDEEDTDIKLYLDMQGGARTAIFVINAVVNMLQSQKHISLERSYAISFSFDNWFNEIRDETMSNHVLELVSGMDEFLNYGKANKFEQYYNHYKEMKYGDKTVEIAEDSLIRNIKEIADTISLCNVNGMYEALDTLKNEIQNYNAKDETEKEPIFKSFVNNLEANYSAIWNTDRKATDVMKWCLDHELFQQTLTVCESKFPTQLVDEGVVYYCNSEAGKKILMKKLLRLANNAGSKERYKLSDVDHYMIKDYLFKLESRATKIMSLLSDGTFFTKFDINDKILDKSGNNTPTIECILRQYFELCTWRNHVNHVGKKNNIDKASFKKGFEELFSYISKLNCTEEDADIIKISSEEVNVALYVKELVDEGKLDEAKQYCVSEFPRILEETGILYYENEKEKENFEKNCISKIKSHSNMEDKAKAIIQFIEKGNLSSDYYNEFGNSSNGNPKDTESRDKLQELLEHYLTLFYWNSIGNSGIGKLRRTLKEMVEKYEEICNGLESGSAVATNTTGMATPQNNKNGKRGPLWKQPTGSSIMSNALKNIKLK